MPPPLKPQEAPAVPTKAPTTAPRSLIGKLVLTGTLLLPVGVVGTLIAYKIHDLFQGEQTSASAEDDGASTHETLEHNAQLVGRKIRLILRNREGVNETVYATFVREDGELRLHMNTRRYAVPSFSPLVTSITFHRDDDQVRLHSDQMGFARMQWAEFEQVAHELWCFDQRAVTVTPYGVYEGMGMRLEGRCPLVFERQDAQPQQ